MRKDPREFVLGGEDVTGKRVAGENGVFSGRLGGELKRDAEEDIKDRSRRRQISFPRKYYQFLLS